MAFHPHRYFHYVIISYIGPVRFTPQFQQIPTPRVHRPTSSIRPLTRLTRFCREWSIYYSRPDCSPGCHLKGSKKQPRRIYQPMRRCMRRLCAAKGSLWFFNFGVCTQSGRSILQSAVCATKVFGNAWRLWCPRQYSWWLRLFFFFPTSHLFFGFCCPCFDFYEVEPGVIVSGFVRFSLNSAIVAREQCNHAGGDNVEGASNNIVIAGQIPYVSGYNSNVALSWVECLKKLTWSSKA